MKPKLSSHYGFKCSNNKNYNFKTNHCHYNSHDSSLGSRCFAVLIPENKNSFFKTI